MSAFTPEQQAEIDKAIAAGVANYAKADSAWQKLRREHPLAVQNVAIGLLVISILVNAWQYFRPLAA